MITSYPSLNAAEFCGTSYAAKLLRVSIGTVQNLVEKNELEAWKTQGGHRRISLLSIRNYLHRNNLIEAPLFRAADHLRLVIVEDDENSRLMLQAYFDQWAMPIDVVMYSSAIEALLDMPTLQPQVLITDLIMPDINGFQFLKILAEHTVFAKLTVIVITGMSKANITENGGLPDGVHVLEKPIDVEWLKGFFSALVSIHQANFR